MILCPIACDIREIQTENSSDGTLLQLAIDSAPALSSSSCAVDFTTLCEVDQGPMTLKEPQTVPLDDEAHEDDDEGFDNETFDNDEDDEGDALQGEGGRSSRGKWTAEEDETLRDAVQRHGGRNWKRISDCLEGRTDVQCLHRWQKVLRPGLIKGPWTKEEDDNVCDLVGKHGMKSWSFIARQLKGRLGKQCRERWYNHLNPDINRAPWSAEEDAMIIEEHKKKGNKWAEIAKAITGRTDNAIKNRWNSTLQRIILQKSAEWTPKKSKKKPRGDDEIEGEGETPGTGSLKARRSSVKKTKVKKIVEEEEIEYEDEHSDANILLLLSASKMSVGGGKAKVLKAKSPSKRALKLLIKEAEAEQDNLDSGLTSTSTSPHKKQKFKRIMKQFVSSISNAPPGVQESGSRIQNVEISLWSPGGLVLKTEHPKNPVDVDYLSPRPEREEVCIDGDNQRNSDCLALFSAGPAQRENADLPRGKRRLQCNSAPHPSAPINFDDYDWTSANSFGQPAKRKKYITKKTTETNDAAAVLSLAPLIQVIGNSLDLENEGEHQEGQDGGTTCSSDDVEREWDGEGDEEISSTSTEAPTEPEDHPLSSKLCSKSNDGVGVVAAAAGSFEAVPQVSPQAIESFSSSGVEEQKDDQEKQFFRAELLLTMRTPSITHVQT